MEDYGVFNKNAYDETLTGYDAVRMLRYIEQLNRTMVLSVRQADSQDAVKMFLENVMRGFEAERAYVFLTNSQGNYDASVEVMLPGLPSYLAELQNIPEARFGHEWFDAFRQEHSFTVMDLEQYKKINPGMYDLLEHFKIRRVIACPIMYGESLLGFAALDNPPEKSMLIASSIFQVCANYIAVFLRSQRQIGFTGEARHIDSITGLYSPNIFRRSLSLFLSSLNKGERTGHFAVVYFNAFQFGAFNSLHGYEEGDLFLREFGQTIRRAIRSDYVTRTEADRFYAIVEAEKAETAVRGVHEEMQHHGSRSLGIYAGIYYIEEGVTEGSKAMDRAKLAADAVEVDHVHYYKIYQPEMEERLNLQSYLVSHLDEALERGFVQAFYQPVVSTLSRRVNGFEALSRWIDPTYGFLNPDAFISTLEDARLLYKLDLYVIECVCQDIVNARDNGIPLSGISVNLSRHDLELQGLHEKINQILFHYRVPHDAIHIEITETALISNENIVQEHIRRFHQDGYEVWLDDFGSGYSSLNTLQNFDFDCVKIDLMFLRHATERTPIIMASIVDMAKKLGMMALTEGVETEEQFEYIAKIGCNFGQGYYFSKPLPLSEVLQKENIQALGLVLPDERVFFRSISHVNFLNPTGAFNGRDFNEIDATPFALLEVDEDDSYRVLHANASILGYAKEVLGQELPMSGSFSEIAGGHVFPTLFRRAEETGETSSYDFVTRKGVGRLEVRFVSRYREKRAFLVTGTNLTSFLEKAVEHGKTLGRNVGVKLGTDLGSKLGTGLAVKPGTDLGTRIALMRQQAAENGLLTIGSFGEDSQDNETAVMDNSHADQNYFQPAGMPFLLPYNMKHFMEQKDAFLSKMQESGKHCGVIALQLLGQKEFVDMYGEKERMVLLTEVSDAICKHCPEDTLIGSVAMGDIMILTACQDGGELKELEQSLTEMLGSFHKLSDGTPVTLYFLIGMRMHRNIRDLSETIAMAKADMKPQDEIRTVYEASKKNGARDAMLALRTALKEKTLEVRYRPRISAIGGKISSYTVVLCWRDQAGNICYAKDHYPDMRQQNLMMEVELYVLNEICRDISNWNRAGKTTLPLDMHFSIENFADPEYFKAFNDVLERYHIDPFFLSVEFALPEIRDNVLLADQVIRQFRLRGHKIRANQLSGDLESLNLFRRFQFDYVRFRVRPYALDDEKMRTIIRESVNMLKQLGVFVTAEQVSSAAQAEFLKAIGCNTLSGPYICEALLEPEIEGALAEKKLVPATPEELDLYHTLGAVNPMNLDSTEKVFNRKILEERTVSYVTRRRADDAGIPGMPSEAEGVESADVLRTSKENDSEAVDGSRKNDEKPIAVSKLKFGEKAEIVTQPENIQNGNFDLIETIYTNEVGLAVMRKLGFNSMAEMNKQMTDPSTDGYHQIINCMNQCCQIGDIAEVEYHSGRLRATLRMELVYELHGKQYFLSLMRNPQVVDG